MNTVASSNNLRKGLRGTLIGLCSAAALMGTPTAGAGVLNWTFTGPGSTDITSSAASTRFDYNLVGPSVYQKQTWTATATAADAGDYTFDWVYAGFHAFFRTNAFLNATDAAGTTSLLNFSPFDGFHVAGTHTFTNVNAGDMLALTFGGTNFDSNATLRGTVSLTQTSEVPEPASLALLSLGLMGVVAARRKRCS